jgi:GT2 family glycosyltransferase
VISGHGRPRVYAIVLNWNSYDYNAACIASLCRSVYPFEKIVVVDNGSADGSCERLMQEFTGDRFAFVRNAKNEGFAGGMNIGFRFALADGADMVYSINNDTETDPECLGRLVEGLEADPSSGVAGPAIMYFKNPERIWLVGGTFSPLRAGIIVPEKGVRIQDTPQHSRRVTFLTGCAILVRKEVFARIGFLDTSYFFYSEDLDFDLRVLEAGIGLLYVPTARVWHKIDEVATDRTSPYVLYHLARSTVLVFRKRFGIPYRWYAVLLQIVLYTPFRFWQVSRGGSGWDSSAAWLKGLWAGMRADRTLPVADAG